MFGWTPCLADSSDIVEAPVKASRATRALNSAENLRLFFISITSKIKLISTLTHCPIFRNHLSIPDLVDTYRKPLFIENATLDKRTKDYKSIFKHNILSVEPVSNFV
jgi:hypothetical protein